MKKFLIGLMAITAIGISSNAFGFEPKSYKTLQASLKGTESVLKNRDAIINLNNETIKALQGIIAVLSSVMVEDNSILDQEQQLILKNIVLELEGKEPLVPKDESSATRMERAKAWLGATWANVASRFAKK